MEKQNLNEKYISISLSSNRMIFVKNVMIPILIKRDDSDEFENSEIDLLSLISIAKTPPL